MPAQMVGKHRSIRGLRVCKRVKSCSWRDLAILWRNKPELMCTDSMLNPAERTVGRPSVAAPPSNHPYSTSACEDFLQRQHHLER